MIEIKPATKKELPILATLAKKLWPHHTLEELKLELEEKFFKEVFFLAKFSNTFVGFAEFSLRHDYVEGTSSSPVLYLEGIYVQPDFRRQNIASQLLSAGKKWGKTMDCSELASDTDVDNHLSQIFHKKLGFQKVGRLICFSQKI